MTLDIFAFLSAEAPGDPVLFRFGVLALVALVAFHWPLELRRNWHLWSRRTRRIFTATFPLLVVNGALLLSAAEREDPIRVGTWMLAGSFALLAGSLLLRAENDNTLKETK